MVSGCGAVGSALPWGGRGRTFKSCHSDQNRRFNRTSDFSLFYGLFRAFLLFTAVYTASKTSAFFAQNRLKIGYDHMFDHICHKKAICHKGFRHFMIFILYKMTAVLCFENRRLSFSIGFFFVYCVSIIDFTLLIVCRLIVFKMI